MDIFKIRDVVYINLLKYTAIDIKQGIMTFIQGESGSGKSSLLRLLNYSRSYDSGTIFYKDKLLTEYDPLQLRQEVSLVAQEVFLVGGSIYDNFQFFYQARGLAVPDDITLQKFLQIACLPVALDKDTQHLSGGEKQRVYLAIFLSFGPQVLMLDEPTAALDEVTSKQIIENIKNYARQQGTTVLVISHSQDLAKTYADEIIYISKGEVSNA